MELSWNYPVEPMTQINMYGCFESSDELSIEKYKRPEMEGTAKGL